MTHERLERLIASECGTAVRVVAVEELAHLRGVVTRVTVSPPLVGAGPTLIVKRRDAENEVGAFAAINLATEQAALELLARADVDVSPRIVAGGNEAGMLVLTDVGRPLEDTIFGSDRAAATSALVALGITTARLHRVAYDPLAFSGIDTWTIASRDDGWDAFIEAAAHLDLPIPDATGHAEHDDLVAELQSPGAATGFVHGDLGPNNAVLDADGTARLVDFEGAGFQHIGLDAAMLRFPFAWYGRWAPVPTTVQRAMERAYRDELGWPSELIDEAMAVGCMAMTLLRLERLPRIAAENQPPDAAFRRRVQIVATIDVAIAAARHVGRFPTLCAWLDALSAAMRRRWPQARQTAPAYPAFTSA